MFVLSFNSSIIDLWTSSKLASTPPNKWFSKVFNFFEFCDYKLDSKESHTIIQENQI